MMVAMTMTFSRYRAHFRVVLGLKHSLKKASCWGKTKTSHDAKIILAVRDLLGAPLLWLLMSPLKKKKKTSSKLKSSAGVLFYSGSASLSPGRFEGMCLVTSRRMAGASHPTTVATAIPLC